MKKKAKKSIRKSIGKRRYDELTTQFVTLRAAVIALDTYMTRRFVEISALQPVRLNSIQQKVFKDLTERILALEQYPRPSNKSKKRSCQKKN
jgi:hypothetical protein